MRRRDFASGAIVYSLAPRPAPAQSKPIGANDQIGFGFIGSGIRGTQLIEEFRPIPGLKYLAVSDLYDGCLARAKEQIDDSILTTKDYRAVLDRKDIDAVVIAAPDHWHKRIVLDALAAGKHVYVEKPLTWSIEEGAAIIAAEKASGRVLQVGSQAKMSPLTAQARQMIKDGAIGKVTMVRMANHRNSAMGAWKYEVPPNASTRTIDWKQFLGDRPTRPFDPNIFFRWRCWWEFSGGVATDLFVHLLTWLHEVMDVKAPVSAVSQGGLYFWRDGRNVPDVMNTIFEYEAGFIVEMYVHLANSFPAPGNIIMGTEGSLMDDGDTLTFYPEPLQHGVQSYGTLQWPKAMRRAYFESKGWTPEGRPKEPLPRRRGPEPVKVEPGPSHNEWFVKSMREGIPSRENATEGHLAAGAGHLANLAYRRGRKLKWDWQTGKVQDA